MLIKILASTSVEAAFHYNERKMDGPSGERTDKEVQEEFDKENGHILATRNLPEGRELLAEFDRMEDEALRKKKRGRKLSNTSFHMVLSPSDTDAELSEHEAVELIDRIIKGLGYEKQPYRIYEHNDTGRRHWHIVSIRTNENGKIDDSYERIKAHRVLQSLEMEYGFTAVPFKGDEKKETKEEKPSVSEIQEETNLFPVEGQEPTDDKEQADKKESVKKDFVPHFDSRSEVPTREQIKRIHEDALKWHFSTFEQYQALLVRRYNVMLTLRNKENGIEVISYGMSSKGKPKTVGIPESEIDMQLMLRIQSRILESDMKAYKKQRKRLETLADAATSVSSSYEEYKKTLEKKGVYLVVSWNENGEPFGITWIDRATKCIWKGSETAVDIKWLKAMTEKNGWSITEDPKENLTRKVRSRVSQTVARKRITHSITTARQKRTATAINVSIPSIRGAHHQEGGNTLRGDTDLDPRKKRRDDDDEHGNENTM